MTMLEPEDFATPEEIVSPMERHLRAVIRSWATEEVLPRRRRYDEDWEHHRLVGPALDSIMAGRGIQRALFPADLGGWSLGTSDGVFKTTFALAEEMGRADTGMAVAAMVTLWPLSTILVEPFLNRRLAEELAPRFASQEKACLAALAMTEPQGGADIENVGLLGGRTVRTTARREGDEWVVTGHKLWPTNTGGVADLLVVPCTTDLGSSDPSDLALIFIPADAPGVTQGGPYEKAGMAADKNGDIWLEQVRVPSWYRAHGPGRDAEAFLSALPLGLVASIGFLTGAMLDVYRVLHGFVSTRTLAGRPLREHDAVAAVVARIAGDIDICRIVGYEAAQIGDRRSLPCGQPLASERILGRLRSIKDFVCDRAVDNLAKAVDVMGPEGPDRSFDVEKHWRDIKMIQLWMGGKQLCEMEAARAYLGSETL